MLPYRPAAHNTHTLAPIKLYVPTPQTTAVEFVDPAGHTYPALQFTHALHPLKLYRPALHISAIAVTLPLTGHTYPALQFTHDDHPLSLY